GSPRLDGAGLSRRRPRHPRGPVRFSAATSCSYLSGCHPRPVNAYLLGTFDIVVDERGVHAKTRDGQGPIPIAWIRGLLALVFASVLLLSFDWWLKRGAEEGPRKIWRLAFIQYIQSLEVDEAEAGVRAGLKESGFVEGEDYEITVRNASGDMPTIVG